MMRREAIGSVLEAIGKTFGIGAWHQVNKITKTKLLEKFLTSTLFFWLILSSENTFAQEVLPADERDRYREITTTVGETLLSEIRDSKKTDDKEIGVNGVYVPYPPGESGIVGQYECPLMPTDAGQLRSIAVDHFLENDLQIIYSKGTRNFSVVLALKNTEEESQFLAYEAQIGLEIIPDTPMQGGPISCQIKLSSHAISGETVGGLRNISNAKYHGDQITQGLFLRFRHFSKNASEREPRMRLPDMRNILPRNLFRF